MRKNWNSLRQRQVPTPGAPANIARRREEQRIAAAEALAGGELPEGFGEDYNVFLAEGGRAGGGDAENPFIEEAERLAQAEAAAEAEAASEPNPFLEGEAAASGDADEAEPNPLLEEAEEVSER
jgi:hypothetical protein